MLIIVSMLAIIMKLIYNKLNMLNKINFVMKLPLISGYFQLFKTYFVTNELVLFYKNGITLQSIVDVYINHSSDPFRQFLGKYLLTYSEMGYGLPQILEKLKCFKPQLIKFVLQGEKRGKLEVELKLYSQILVKQIEDKAIKQTQFYSLFYFDFRFIYCRNLFGNYVTNVSNDAKYKIMEVNICLNFLRKLKRLH